MHKCPYSHIAFALTSLSTHLYVYIYLYATYTHIQRHIPISVYASAALLSSAKTWFVTAKNIVIIKTKYLLLYTKKTSKGKYTGNLSTNVYYAYMYIVFM